MFNVIDRKIKKFLEKILHKRKRKFIDQALQKFIETHPRINQAKINELKEKLEEESDRVYAIVDKSLLEAGIKRARFTFWLTAALSLVLVGPLIVFTSGVALPIFTPLIMAIIAWLVSLVTIPINYNERVIGGMGCSRTGF